MNLAYPFAIFWGLLALPIIVFYILKIQLRRVPVSTTIFWRQIFEEKQARSLWQYLRHLLSLLLQLLLLFLMVFALAEPFFHWEVLDARRMVIVIDTSASMNATDLSPSRLERARAEGQRLISSLRFRDEVALVAAGTQPQVLCGLTGHQGTLQDALNAVTPTDGPTRVHEAVALARRLLVDQENGQIVVLTDGCFDDAQKLIAAPDVRIFQFGEKTANAGITRFQVRRSFVDLHGYEVLAEVVNHSAEPLECRFELDLNEQLVDVVPLKIQPGQTWSQTFSKATADGGVLRGRLLHDDALPADNQAVALLPRRDPQPVILVTDGNLFLEKVFEANRLVRLSVAKEAPAQIPPGTIVVFHRKTPAKLPAGNLFVIDPGASTDLWQVGETLQNPIVTKQDKDSQLLTHVRLDNVLMPEARKLTIPSEHKVLVGAVSGDPLYVSFDRPEGKVLVLTVNLDKGDLPLRTAFPILTTNSLAWFAGTTGELKEALATGSTADVDVPSNAIGEELFLYPPAFAKPPAGESGGIRLPSGVTRTTVGPLDRCGVWRIAGPPNPQTKEPPAALVELAVNLANRRESDLRPADVLLGSGAEESSSLAAWATRPIWFYLLTAAFLLAVMEWYLYQRRWIS